jgi:hypothetical protein
VSDNHAKAERATALYEERVLGRKIANFKEGLDALLYMLDTPEGKVILAESFAATPEDAEQKP